MPLLVLMIGTALLTGCRDRASGSTPEAVHADDCTRAYLRSLNPQPTLGTTWLVSLAILPICLHMWVN
jgi:hypothetical protein